ncbi:hypothetical protein K4U37_04620, partial [Staphylococcus epidermidis]|nr:hypothetical protein [Staphylococcus epidermidis]
SKASWGSGPQHREFHREIQQAKQVGVRGPNTENFTGKFNKQSKLGFGIFYVWQRIQIEF